jgi:hypothetical protein
MQRLDLGPFFLQIINADGSERGAEIRFSSLESAIAQADRVQRELDDEGVAARAFVVDVAAVPIAAGGELVENRRGSYKRAAWR